MKKQEPEVAVVADFETAVEPVAVSDPVPWTVGTWGELPQWRCVLCPFDTLDGEAEIRAHYATVHAPPPPAAPAPTVLRADRFGNPV